MEEQDYALETVSETPEQPKVGVRLRALRESEGLDLSDISLRTRISMRHLQNIEKSNYEAFPSPTYIIGFVRTYARALSQNEEAYVDDVRNELGRTLARDDIQNSNYVPADPKRIFPVNLIWISLLLAALVFGGYYGWKRYQNTQASAAVAQADSPAGSIDNAAMGAVNTSSGYPLDNGTANAALPTAGTSAALGNVVISATGLSYVKIYDADKKILLEKIMHTGESYTLPSGVNGAMIHTGAANNLTFSVNGKSPVQLGDGKNVVTLSLNPNDLNTRTAPPAPSSISGAPK
jgi:cytoskeleton protein RodZ